MRITTRMTRKSASEAERLLAELDELLGSVELGDASDHQRRKLIARTRSLKGALDRLARRADRVALPTAFFDPADPNLIGSFVALALIAQDRRPLAAMSPFYGAGIYALYYTGGTTPYGPISGTETPIYVGKADPPSVAKTIIEQGTKLYARLNEHRRNIDKVAGIEMADFECRALAVQSGYQTAAEADLIRLFKPIWNNETKILFGLGKHGDSAKTRANKRSPFDTLHPGRPWAEGNEPSKTVAEIKTEAEAHFAETAIFGSVSEVFEAFMTIIRQEEELDGTKAEGAT